MTYVPPLTEIQITRTLERHELVGAEVIGATTTDGVRMLTVRHEVTGVAQLVVPDDVLQMTPEHDAAPRRPVFDRGTEEAP